MADCYVAQKNVAGAENVLKHALDVCNAFKLKPKMPFNHVFGPGSQSAKKLQSKLDAVRKKS